MGQGFIRLSTVLCPYFVIPGGSSVAVHPGLQGFVQTDVRAVVAGGMADPGRQGFLREDHRALVAEEGHRVRDQSATVLQRVPGNGQRIEDGED